MLLILKDLFFLISDSHAFWVAVFLWILQESALALGLLWLHDHGVSLRVGILPNPLHQPGHS